MAILFKTPILFIVFNRLDTTKRVFNEIRKIKPKKLYIAADGPRLKKEGEKEQCDEVRKYILDSVDWACEIKTLFRDENLGCGKAVSSAITWYFENVPQGIILEDDCLPNPSFFNYCEELLDRYKNNKKVMSISGDQFAPPMENGPSYYFAKIMHCWGWASWADRWENYDLGLKNFEEKNIRNFSSDKNVQKYWSWILKILRDKEIDTWDYQWTFTIVGNNGLCINPSKNLISNIGFGESSTHTSNEKDSIANLPTYKIDKMIHPEKIEINQKAVNYIYRNHCRINFDQPDKEDLCKICGNKREIIFCKKILSKYPVSYYKCSRCGFIQTEKPYWLKESYSDAITSTDIGLVNRNIHYSNIVENILISGKFNKNGRFLDYAGGYGMFTRIMRDKGFNYYRDDKYCNNLFAKYFDINDLPRKSKEFELITAFEFMEHIENPFKELGYLFSLTDSFLFTTDLIPEQDLENWWYLGTEHGQHISFYTKNSLKRIARKYNKYYYSKDSLHLMTSKKNLDIFKNKAKSPILGILKKVEEKISPKEEFLPSKTWDDFQMVIKKQNRNVNP